MWAQATTRSHSSNQQSQGYVPLHHLGVRIYPLRSSASWAHDFVTRRHVVLTYVRAECISQCESTENNDFPTAFWNHVHQSSFLSHTPRRSVVKLHSVLWCTHVSFSAQEVNRFQFRRDFHLSHGAIWVAVRVLCVTVSVPCPSSVAMLNNS